MAKKLRIDLGDMALALAVWFCTLPIIGFIAIPLLGRQQALIIAIAAFFLIMAICWGICGVKQYEALSRDRKNASSSVDFDPKSSLKGR
jgi:hypothetical protein